MKKCKRWLTLLFAVCLIVFIPVTANAESAATYTYTPGVDDGWVRTQDAYQVTQVILQEVALSQPQDILVKDGILYIADTGSGKVVLYDLKTMEVTEWGVGELTSPAGLFLTEDKQLYVADNVAGEVVRFNENGEILQRFGRPTTATFGSDATYRPSKVVVNAAGTVYVVSEGSYDGMIQLDQKGEFLGYFGYNNNPLTLWDYIADYFFTDEMKAQLTNRVPYSFKNTAIDEKGMIYTVTQSAEGNALKKHDVAGHNLFPDDMVDEKDFVDVCVGPGKRVYAVTGTGLLFEYDANGEVLFTFGGRAIAEEKNGVFTTVSAITCDEEGRLYVLDAERGLVHVLKATDYARNYHDAIDLYNSGDYEGSALLWRHIKAVGGTSFYAENYLGQCLYEQGDYKGAATHYKLAGNIGGYSDAYWQIRNDDIAALLPYIIVTVVALMIVRFLIDRFYDPEEKVRKPGIWKEDTKMLFKVLKHPIDTFYDVRRENKGHMITAFALYVVEFGVFLAYFLGSGFALIGNSAQHASVIFLSCVFWAPVMLFIVSNFLVCEVGEGKARFRDVFISTAYVFAPVVVLMPLVIVLSHMITGNELALLELGIIAILGWTVVNLLIATMQIHVFELREAIVHLLITAFLMAVIVLAVSLIYMLCEEMVDMVISVVKEVYYRVFLS
jgi:hypothetical protein